MSFISKNVIPGNHGKVFGTNATTEIEMARIQAAVADVEGVKEVIVNNTVFPKEFTVHTTKMLTVENIEQAVIETGFHAIPKNLFEL